MKELHSSASWNTYAEDGVQLVVGCLQVFIYKSQTIVMDAHIVLYPFHVALRNLREE